MNKLAIVVDTRESVPYLFKKMKDVFVVRDNLDVGDFSLLHFENEIMIERKTLADLAGSFTAGRERFEDEWQRARAHLVKILLIEGRITDIILGNYRSMFHAHSFFATLMSWQIKYGFSTIFVEGSAEGQEVVVEICKQYKRLRNGGYENAEEKSS